MKGDALNCEAGHSTATWRGATKTRTWCLGAVADVLGSYHVPREEDWQGDHVGSELGTTVTT